MRINLTLIKEMKMLCKKLNNLEHRLLLRLKTLLLLKPKLLPLLEPSQPRKLKKRITRPNLSSDSLKKKPLMNLNKETLHWKPKLKNLEPKSPLQLNPNIKWLLEMPLWKKRLNNLEKKSLLKNWMLIKMMLKKWDSCKLFYPRWKIWDLKNKLSNIWEMKQ